MKIGDKVPVTIAGQTVAQATIKETADGTATLVVPATLVVMATRTELAYEAPNAEPERETIITGVDRASGEESAPVSETPNIDNSEQDNSTDNGESNTSVVESEPVESATEVASDAPVAAPPTSDAPVGGNDEVSS